MPVRLLRDGILESEAVCSLQWAAEVFYRRLMSVVDDYGRFHATPMLIRAKCYPLQIDKVSDSDIGKWLTQVVEAGLVRVYRAEDRKSYLEIVKFGQQVRAKSKFPEPSAIEEQQTLAPDSNCLQLPASAHLDVFVFGDVCEDDKEISPTAHPSGEGRFPEFWDIWPKTDRKQDRKKCLAKWVKLKLDAKADVVIAHVQAMKLTRKWIDGFDPLPMTYLNGERWNDEVPPDRPSRETDYEASMRSKYQQLAPMVAKRTSATLPPNPMEILDAITENAKRIAR